MEQIIETYIHNYVHTTSARKTEGKSHLVKNKYRWQDIINIQL